MKIALISDLPTLIYSAKVNRTIESHHRLLIETMESALCKLGHEIICIEANSALKEELLKTKPQLVFNRSIRKGDYPDRAFVPSLLEALDIPYTGSSAQVCSNAFDKKKTKHILQKARIPIPNYFIVADTDTIQIPLSLSFPLFIKPIKGGCSRGIDERNPAYSKVVAVEIIRATIDQNHQPALVEEFITGREFTAGILEYDSPLVLPILEIIHNGSNFRSFTTKMIEKNRERKSCPAILSRSEESRIRNLALKTFHALGCRDYARIDMRCDEDGNPYILEVNALPSLIPSGSSFHVMAKAAGMSLEELIHTILVSTCKRYNINITDP